MNTRKSLLLAVLLISAAPIQMAFAQEHPTTAEHPAKKDPAVSPNNCVAVASQMDDLTTLVTAIKAAGLTAELEGKGPFTIFAPSNEAFANLPEGMLEDLLKPANKAQLAGILAFHVVPGKIMAADIKTMKATNVAGQDLNLNVAKDVVTVNGAKVIQADIVASNGVIQVIDAVLIPTKPAEMPLSDKPKDHPAH